MDVNKRVFKRKIYDDFLAIFRPNLLKTPLVIKQQAYLAGAKILIQWQNCSTIWKTA